MPLCMLKRWWTGIPHLPAGSLFNFATSRFPLPTWLRPKWSKLKRGVATWQVVDVRQRQSLRFDFDWNSNWKTNCSRASWGPSQRSHEVAAGRSKKLNIWLGEQPDDSWVVHPASSPANIALVFRASGKCQLDLNRRTAHYLLTKWNLKMSLCPWQQARDDDADADADGDDDVATCPM